MVVLDIQLILCIFAFAITITNGGGGGKKEKVHIKIHVPKLIHHEKHVKTIYIHVHHKADPPKHKGHEHHDHHSHHSGHEHHSHHDGHKHHHYGGHHGGHMGGGGGGHGHHHHGHGGGGHKMMHGGKKHMGGGKKKGHDHPKSSIVTYSYGHGKRGHSFTNVKPVREHYVESKNANAHYGPVTFEQMMMHQQQQQQQQKQEDPFGTYEFDAFSIVDGPAGNYEQPPVDSYGQVQQDDGYAKAAALRNGGNDIHMYHYPPISTNQMAVVAKKAPGGVDEEYSNFIEEEHLEHGHDAEDEVHREKGDYHNEEYNHIDKEAEGEHGKYNKGGYKKKTKNSKYEKLFDQHSGGYLEY